MFDILFDVFFFFYQFASLLPSNKKRSLVVHGLVQSLGLLLKDDPDPAFGERRIRTCSPRKATRRDLAMYHSKAYLDFVLDSANSAERGGERHDSEYASLKAEFGMEDVGTLFFFLTAVSFVDDFSFE